jgi:hypothetical protein
MAMSSASAAMSRAQPSLAIRSLRWALSRLAVYLVAAVVSIAVFTAGAAFYRYVWFEAKSVHQAPKAPQEKQTPSESAPKPLKTEPLVILPSPTASAAPLSGSLSGSYGAPKPNGLTVPQTSISKAADKDLIGKKVVNPEGVGLGFIVQVTRNTQGTVVSIGISGSPQPNTDSPITPVKVTPTP